jgi:hypothetical protein
LWGSPKGGPSSIGCPRNERPNDKRDCWLPDPDALVGTGTRFSSPLKQFVSGLKLQSLRRKLERPKRQRSVKQPPSKQPRKLRRHDRQPNKRPLMRAGMLHQKASDNWQKTNCLGPMVTSPACSSGVRQLFATAVIAASFGVRGARRENLREAFRRGSRASNQYAGTQ